MSRTLHFYTQGRIVTIDFKRKTQLSKNYVPASLSIMVGPSNSDHSTYETDLNEDYVFTHFSNLSAFFSFLKKSKDQEGVLRFDNSETLAVLIRNEEGSVDQEELIDLSRVQVVEEREFDEVSHRVDFYNQFKTRIIHKIQKIVKKHYKTSNQGEHQLNRPKEQNNTMIKSTRKKEEKRTRLISPLSQIIFTVSTDGYQKQYALNQHTTKFSFIASVSQLQRQQFRIKVNSLKYDKIVVSVECTPKEEFSQAGAIETELVRRFCQFGKSMSSWFRVEEGEEIEVGVQLGEVYIRNRDSNMGKMFDNLIRGSEQQWICKIWVSLQEI